MSTRPPERPNRHTRSLTLLEEDQEISALYVKIQFLDIRNVLLALAFTMSLY